LLRDGIAAARAGARDEARPLLRAAAALDPCSEAAWLWLAGLAEAPLEAVDCLERVLALNPTHERARAALKSARLRAGVAAAKAGDKDQARRLLRAVVAHDPSNESAWLWLASVSETPPDAVACLERVLQINPLNERARAGLERYRTYFAAAPQPAPAEEPAPEAAAWECPLCGHGDDQEHEECPECGALLVLTDEEGYLGRDWVKESRLQTAVARLAPEAHHDAAAAYHLGLAYLNLADVDRAIAALQTALRLRPGDRGLRDWLDVRGCAPVPERPRNRRRTVLVVDDSPTVRQAVSQILERGGCRVHTAAGGYEAIDSLRDKGVPDLIFLDVAMPGLDGYQLCKLLRHNADTAQVPIVMLSGKDGFFSKVRGRLSGSTEYLTKPFEAEGLLRIVDKYCPAEDATEAAHA
jgi:twitching motility two-component system response regulator PilG